MPLTAQRLEAARPTLDELLLSGGDARLALDRATGFNAYGCAPHPRAEVDDFSSSTASSISERGYARAERSWRRLSQCGPAALDAFVEDARAELKSALGLEAEIVFSPSGTDAQLLALFLARGLLGTPLVSIIAGADQTGSGAAFTAKGLHFIDRGIIHKGDAVEGLAQGTRSIGISFCDAAGRPRTLAELDGAIVEAVETAIAGGATVMLQAMASSKLGWAAPSAACMDELMRRWPGKLQIVIDACQMRVGTARLRDYLSRGFIVLATGSKFFCGPAFSGALLIPPTLNAAIAAIDDVPTGLALCASASDWPACWPGLRRAFSGDANIGQWLRWEAALEEIGAYQSVPASFRATVLARFARGAQELLAASSWLVPFDGAIHDPDPARDGEFAVPTIFSFIPKADAAFTRAQCATMHQVLNRDISARLPAQSLAERRLAARICHIGQPVAIGDGAILRVSSSARLVTRCWSLDPAIAAARLDAGIARLEQVVRKLALVAREFALIAP